MKTDRFTPASMGAAAVIIAGLLLAGLPAAGQTIIFRFGKKQSAGGVAAALARHVGEVAKRFDKDRRALRSVPGPGGEPAYLHGEVAGLITRTEKDLDQAIEQVGEPGLEALRAWAAEEFRRIEEELATPRDRAAALSPGLSTPRAVARIASLGGHPSPESVIAAASQETVSAARSKGLLDQVGEVVGRVFVLAKKDDLEVDLWVGSTPAPQATFRFWSLGKIKGAAPAHTTVQTGKRKRVLRGLYAYKAAWTRGAVTELIEYPSSGDRLDLVNGTSFFCCAFNQQSCGHVDNEKECR